MTAEIEAAFAKAETLAQEAAELGFIQEPTNTLAKTALHLARVDVLSRMLMETRMGQWLEPDNVNVDWEFPNAFGSVVRMAHFELRHVPETAGWEHLHLLFRLYLGGDAAKIMIPVFLAAVTSPGLILSSKLIDDCNRITDELVPGQTALEN